MSTQLLQGDIVYRRTMAEHLRRLADALDCKECDSIPVDWNSIYQRVQEISQFLTTATREVHLGRVF